MSPVVASSVFDRDAYRRALLKEATDRCHQVGRRLVLVVDGLDEDMGTRPGTGLPSIASLLPKNPHLDLRVIVASRPHPDLPDDVPTDHPLYTCQPQTLAPSEHAADTARLAKRELHELLAQDNDQRDIIGLITASGGGLALPDLEVLSDVPRHRLDSLVNGHLGRTISARSNADGDYQRAYLFSHETLRVEAIRGLGHRQLANYRDRIHTFADTYRNQTWPQCHVA